MYNKSKHVDNLIVLKEIKSRRVDEKKKKHIRIRQLRLDDAKRHTDIPQIAWWKGEGGKVFKVKQQHITKDDISKQTDDNVSSGGYAQQTAAGDPNSCVTQRRNDANKDGVDGILFQYFFYQFLKFLLEDFLTCFTYLDMSMFNGVTFQTFNFVLVLTGTDLVWANS